VNRRLALISATGGAVLLVVLVAVAVANSTSGPTGAMPAPSGSPSITAGAQPTPSASASGDGPATPPAVDPAYGEPVVAATDDGSAAFASGLSVELVSVTDTTITGSGIGSTSGPAIEVTIRVTNTSSSTLSLTPVVNAYSGDDRVPLTPDESTALASSIAAGEYSDGRYTFALDDATATIWITVSTAPDSGLVVLQHNR